MGYPPIEDLLPKAASSIYKLVRLAANRAMELAEGKPKLIDNPSSEKVSTIALEEIKSSKVVLKEVADKFFPKAKEQKKAKDEDSQAEHKQVEEVTK